MSVRVYIREKPSQQFEENLRGRNISVFNFSGVSALPLFLTHHVTHSHAQPPYMVYPVVKHRGDAHSGNAMTRTRNRRPSLPPPSSLALCTRAQRRRRHLCTNRLY